LNEGSVRRVQDALAKRVGRSDRAIRNSYTISVQTTATTEDGEVGVVLIGVTTGVSISGLGARLKLETYQADPAWIQSCIVPGTPCDLLLSAKPMLPIDIPGAFIGRVERSHNDSYDCFMAVAFRNELDAVTLASIQKMVSTDFSDRKVDIYNTLCNATLQASGYSGCAPCRIPDCTVRERNISLGKTLINTRIPEILRTVNRAEKE